MVDTADTMGQHARATSAECALVLCVCARQMKGQISESVVRKSNRKIHRQLWKFSLPWVHKLRSNFAYAERILCSRWRWRAASPSFTAVFSLVAAPTTLVASRASVTAIAQCLLRHPDFLLVHRGALMHKLLSSFHLTCLVSV